MCGVVLESKKPDLSSQIVVAIEDELLNTLRLTGSSEFAEIQTLSKYTVCILWDAEQNKTK